MKGEQTIEMEFHQRRHPTHGVKEIRNQSTIVLVTACLKDRRNNIADVDIHRLLAEVWREATGWLVGYYMIMPDHIHYFVTRGEIDISLERWSQYWKSQLAKQCPAMRQSWLTDHWDVRIRSSDHYSEKLNYVRMNPVRKGLVTAPEEWPYQGTLFDISWYQSY